jgi:RNA polymerase sigma-70 factor, ECF subfamily
MSSNEPDFEQIVSAYYESLYRFALSLTHSESDARDLTQETFRRLLQKWGQLRDRAKVKTWLFTTLYREHLDTVQRAGRFTSAEGLAAGQELPELAAPPDNSLDGELAREALMGLAEPFRSALVLFYLDDHSYKEIAQILGVPIGTVMSRISRARELLRQRLEGRADKATGCSATMSGAPTEAVS